MDNLPAFKIVKHNYITDYDCCSRQYRNCIINTMINLKSKYIFEIGSFIFQTSNAIAYYLDQFVPDGKLVTADITTRNRGEPPARVHPVMFYPYDEDPSLEDRDINVYYSNYKEVVKKELALELNSLKLFEVMIEQNIRNFDLVFVDGFHSSRSFLSDLYLAQLTAGPDGWILIDDIYPTPGGNTYQQHEIYKQLKRHNDFYEFPDWPTPVCMSLIQNKCLKVK